MKHVKMEKIAQNKLMITLSCTEILQLNSETHLKESADLISSIIKTMDHQYQFSVLNKKILLEMIPSVTEGYDIFLTELPSESNQMPEKTDIFILAFPEFENLIFAGHLLKEEFHGTYLVYLLDETYYLVLYPAPHTHDKKIQIRLCDLGETVSDSVIYESVLFEYAQFVADDKMMRNFLSDDTNDFSCQYSSDKKHLK